MSNEYVNTQGFIYSRIHTEMKRCDVIEIIMDKYFDSWTLADRADIHHAAANGELLTLRTLISKGINVNSSTLDGITPLHEACLRGRALCIKELLKAGSAINARNIDGATPLCDASVHGDVECVKILLENGADVNPHLLSATPLHEAAIRDNWQCMELLIDAGAKLEASDCHFGTPLHISCFKQCTKSVEVLLRAGANVNAVKILESPLHRAAQHNNIEIIELLVEYGANLHGRDNKELKATDYARDKAKELLEYYESTPWSLMHLCRLKIRKILGPKRLRHIRQLSLPQLLTVYLQFY